MAVFLFLWAAAALQGQAARASGEPGQIEGRGDLAVELVELVRRPAIANDSAAKPEGSPARNRAGEGTAGAGPGEPPAFGAEDLQDPSAPRAVEFPPGPAGLHFGGDGIVLDVDHGQQAEKLGVQAGVYATSINGKLFLPGRYAHAVDELEPYTIVFTKVNAPHTALHWLAALADIAAIIDLIGRATSALLSRDESTRQDPKRYLASPVALGFLGLSTVAALTQRMLMLGGSSGYTTAWKSMLLPLGAVILRIGLGFGTWRFLGACPDGALLKPVRMSLAMNVASVALLAGDGALYASWVVAQYIFEPLPLIEYLLPARYLLNAVLACSLSCALANFADSVGGELENLVVEDCDSSTFKARVHTPMVAFLNKSNTDLAKLGLPLVLLCVGFFGEVLDAKHLSLHVQVRAREAHRFLWPALVCVLRPWVRAAGLALAIAAAPLRISAALEAALAKLTKMRSHIPELHLPIGAIETVIAEQNNGRGFGVSIEGHLVISKAFMQRVILTLVGVATVLWSFAERVMGVEEVSVVSLSRQMHHQAQDMKKRIDHLERLVNVTRHHL